MEQPIIVKKNKVTVRPLPALSVCITDPNGDQKHYMLAHEQKVSVLLIRDGKTQVFRGRVESFTGLYPDEVLVTLDISKKSESKLVTFHISNIQEINPIDWIYPNIDPKLIPPPYAYWYEKDDYSVAAVTTRKVPEGFYD